MVHIFTVKYGRYGQIEDLRLYARDQFSKKDKPVDQTAKKSDKPVEVEEGANGNEPDVFDDNVEASKLLDNGTDATQSIYWCERSACARTLCVRRQT